MLKKSFSSLAVAAVLFSATGSFTEVNAVVFPPAPSPVDVLSGTKTTLGWVKVNPYGNAPLTALINLGGETITDVQVKVHGKGKNGLPIEYKVGKQQLLTHDGVPVFGLYADHKNKVTVSFKNLKDNKKYTHTYNILTTGLENKWVDNRNITALPEVKIVKVDKKHADKLFLTNTHEQTTEAVPLAWAGQVNNKDGKLSFTDTPPSTGSLAFTNAPITFITDTKGDYRWWLNGNSLFNELDLDVDNMGYLMGINQTKEGNFTYVMGSNYGEFDLMGRIISKNRLPRGYVDASHEMIEMPNGNLLIRAAKANYKRNDGVIVHTVRDHILEVTKSGNLINVWDLNKSLDPLRDTLLKGLDLGAVCLNVDQDKKGQTADEFEPDAPFGDIAGIGAGRNWAHVNSISYDPSDDTIIISPRHQATAIKLTRDNKVKWILGASAGWNKELSKKLLTPVDKNGKKLDCDENGKCENTDFDFSWTQHTSWLSPNGTLTVLDNGDGRWNEQPALPTDKYTRFVEYKIDDKNMTVQQLWEYGKERGYEWYSPITSNVELVTDDGKPYMYGFGGSINLYSGDRVIGKHNIIDYKTKDVLIEIDVYNTKPGNPHYRGVLIDEDEIFAK